jgi:hypothetical protein
LYRKAERRLKLKLSTLNPITRVTNWLDSTNQKVNSQQTPVASTAVAPAANQSTEVASNEPETTIVTGTFVPAGADELFTESAKQTEQFASVIEQFDEDKQEPIEWAIWKCAAIFCYVAPFALAIPIGLGVGDVFTTPLPGQPISPLMAKPSANIAIHMLCLFLEILMPILGLTAVLAFKRALKSKAAIGGFVFVGLFFITVSLGNAAALFFLLEKGVQLGQDPMTTVITIGRSIGPLILDIGSAIVLSVYAKKSLEKYLADQQRKIEATRRVNDVHVAMETTKTKAAIDRQTAIMDLQSKKQRANTWNELERIQSQAMIEQARRNMGGDGNNDSNGRGRYGGW